jgi:hypothetical protein
VFSGVFIAEEVDGVGDTGSGVKAKLQSWDCSHQVPD